MTKNSINSGKKEKKLTDSFQKVLTKNFWKSHLPWPERIIRKPKIRYTNIFIGKKLPDFLTSRYLALVGVYILLYFFLSGGMYFITGAYREIPLGYGSGNPPEPIIWLNSLNDQFILEGIIAGIFIFIGLIGFILIYYSSKNFYKPTTSYVYLGFGLILVFISFILLENAMNQKGIRLYSADI